jgi:PadR family transcriptional regulator, regulatory protein AphA
MPTRALTTTSFAILGLLALRPSSTYELAGQMRRNLRYLWPRAESRIYAEAKALVDSGMATVERTFVGKRPRSTYRLTSRGRAALKTWLASPPKGGLGLDFEGLLRVFFGSLAEPGDVLAAVEQARTDADELLDVAYTVGREYVEGQAPFQPHVHVRAFVFDFLFSYAHLVRDWSERVATDLRAWDKLDLEGRRQLGRRRIDRAIKTKPQEPRPAGSQVTTETPLQYQRARKPSRHRLA